MATFGNTTQGASQRLISGVTYGNINSSFTYTAVGGEIITSLSFYGGLNIAGTQTAIIAVYTFSGGFPVTLVGSGSVVVNSTTAQLWTVSGLSITLTAGVVYTIAIGGGTSGIMLGNYDTGVANGEYSADFATNPPASWVNSLTGADRITMYATYTPYNPPVYMQKTTVPIQYRDYRVM